MGRAALRIFVGALWAAALMSPSSTGPAAAQEASPAGTPGVLRPAEAGPECLAAPRAVADIAAAVGTAAPGEPPATPAPPPPAPPPPGEPVDPATAAAVETVLRELAACLARGEFARAYALYTDDYLRRSVGPLTEEERGLLEGVAFPNAGERLPPELEVLEVRRLADGRVFALARVTPAGGAAPRLRGFDLVRSGERWLVDGAADVVGEGTPGP